MKQSYKKDIFSVVLAVLQVVAVLAVIAVNVVAGGYETGIFGLDEILFEGISSLANMSDYERVIEAGRVYTLLAAVPLGGVLLGAFLMSKARKNLPQKVGARIAAQIITNTLFLAFAFLLFMYSFAGITRVLLYIAMLISGVLYVYITVKYAVRVGATAFILQGLSFLVAACIVWLICPLIGALFAVLGDIVSFLIVTAVLAGGSTFSVRTVRIIVW